MRIETQKKNKVAPAIGLAACTVFYIAIALTVIPFVGEQGESFSFLNHFISELGNPNFSECHYIFNTGIIIAGTGFGIFAYCLQGLIDSKLAWGSTWMGVVASIFCVGVGLVPSHHGDLHLLVAVTFFSLMTLAMFLYSCSILMDKSKVFPSSIAFYGFAAMVCFILLIFSPKELIEVQNEQKELFDRPEYWLVTIAEWLVFFFLTTWVVLVSVYLLLRKNKQ